jgi:N-acyl-D-aspartate/D-glutamate deacylase
MTEVIPEIYDLVIQKTYVFDGQEALTGLCDVGVRGHEIAAVSETPLMGAREIDGSGCWLMPGLIDTHIHFYDFRVVRDPVSLQAFVDNEIPSHCSISANRVSNPPAFPWLALSPPWT